MIASHVVSSSHHSTVKTATRMTYCSTQIHEALCKRAATDTPIVIEVQGTINHGNTTKVSGDSCNTAADRIELKGISNVTIVGVGSGATFDQLGIHLRDASNITYPNQGHSAAKVVWSDVLERKKRFAKSYQETRVEVRRRLPQSRVSTWC